MTLVIALFRVLAFVRKREFENRPTLKWLASNDPMFSLRISDALFFASESKSNGSIFPKALADPQSLRLSVWSLPSKVFAVFIGNSFKSNPASPNWRFRWRISATKVQRDFPISRFSAKLSLSPTVGILQFLRFFCFLVWCGFFIAVF